jgi:two-component system response regulator
VIPAVALPEGKSLITKTILLVEDEEGDVLLFERALKKAGIANPLRVAKTGQEALDYLAGAGEYADRQRFPQPGLILLDLKLPYVMGLDVLKWIRQQPELRTIIVIVLTSSEHEADIQKAYELGANAYLVKPAVPTQLADMAQAIKHFWLMHNFSTAGVCRESIERS